MVENNMPATEAEDVGLDDSSANADERSSYELAFHILPTVAEGEVANVFRALQEVIQKAGGERFDDESPERVDLAYDIVKHVEGKNRKFHSAYFGWIRFHLAGDALVAIVEALDSNTDVLRYLLVKLTKEEAQRPFRFHEAQKAKRVETVEEKEVKPSERVSEKKLDASLEKIAEGDTDMSKEKTDTIEETSKEAKKE